MRWTIVWVCASGFIFFGVLPAADALGAGSCKVGDTYLKVGLLDQAEKQYNGRQPAPCAREGQDNVDQERIRRGNVAAQILKENDFPRRHRSLIRNSIIGKPEDEVVDAVKGLLVGPKPFVPVIALYEAGMTDAAGEALDLALRRNRDEPVPEELDALPRAVAEQRIDRAEALDEIGFNEEAKEQVEKAIEIDPDVPVPDRLKAEDREPAKWAELKSDVIPWALALAPFVILIGGLILIIGRFRVEFGRFEAGDDKVLATGMPLAINEHLRLITKQSGGRNLSHVDASGEETTDVPAAIPAVVPQAAFVSALLTLLRRFAPRRMWILLGAARERDADKGVGLALTVRRRFGHLVGKVTLWQREFHPAALSKELDEKQAYYELALPAAVWLVFRRRRSEVSTWLLRERRKLLGTSDWKSYALFAVGADCEERGDKNRAEALYWMAIDRDRRNRGALFNLAALYIEADPPRTATSIEFLEEIKRDRRDHWKSDPLWYRAAFWTTVVKLGEADTNRQRQAALRDAIELTETLERHLCGGWPMPRRQSNAVFDLREFLINTEAAMLGHLATALYRVGRNVGDNITNRSELLERLDREWRGVNGDRRVSGKGVAHYVENHSVVDAKGHFNLACYYSRCGKYVKSLEHIGEAVDRDWSLVGIARTDTDLKPLRDNERFKFRFQEIMRAHERPTETKAEADVPTVRVLVNSGRTS
jgi:tetratricopeptide (TPR) repeat protein